MGITYSKAAVVNKEGDADVGSSSSSSSSDTTLPEDLAHTLADSGRGGGVGSGGGGIGGVRFEHVEANNFLGRLEDAERFCRWSLWQRLAVRLGAWQHQRRWQQQQQLLQRQQQLVEQQEQRVVNGVSSASGKMVPSVGSSCCSQLHQHDQQCKGTLNSSNQSHAAYASGDSGGDTSGGCAAADLTTLLRQGFDPQAYEKQQLMARFAQPEKFGFNPRVV